MKEELSEIFSRYSLTFLFTKLYVIASVINIVFIPFLEIALTLFRLGGGHNVPPLQFFSLLYKTAYSRLMKLSDF